MKCCDMDSRSFFLFGARIFFGAWLLYAGFAKFAFMGPSAFVGYIQSQFAQTWAPALLITVLAWIILIGEVVLGALLLVGRHMRCVWALTSLLMFLLMFGQTLLMKETVTDNWHYVVFALACAALSSNNKSACCGSSDKIEKTGCCSKN